MPNKAAETSAICILTSDVTLLLQKVEIKTKTLRNLCISCNGSNFIKLHFMHNPFT